MADTVMICKACGKDFAWSFGEQDYYAKRGYSNPKHCKPCRADRRRGKQAYVRLPGDVK